MKVIVRKGAVREFIREALGGQSWPRAISELPTEEAPVDVNATSSVEDATPPMDPPVDDPEFVPVNSVELAAASDKLARRVEPELIEPYYKHLQRLAKAEEEGKLGRSEENDEPPEDDESDERLSPENQKEAQLEAAIRKRVRQLLEITPRASYSFSGWDVSGERPEEGEEGYQPQRRNITVTDVGGMSFDEIAKALGFAAPIGAKAFVERSMEKFRFLWELREESPADFDKFILLGVNEYISYLRSSGALSDEEVALMHDHPELVVELEGYREYLHKFVKRAMRARKKAAE